MPQNPMILGEFWKEIFDEKAGNLATIWIPP
jgi:hypothetical protein